MSKQPCVYILASGRHGTIYVGVTSNLMQRLYQHRNRITGGFAGKHKVYRLVYFELFEDMISAITREKRLKNWHRDWKVALIEAENPDWRDLALDFGFEPVREHRVHGS